MKDVNGMIILSHLMSTKQKTKKKHMLPAKESRHKMCNGLEHGCTVRQKGDHYVSVSL